MRLASVIACAVSVEELYSGTRVILQKYDPNGFRKKLESLVFTSPAALNFFRVEAKIRRAVGI